MIVPRGVELVVVAVRGRESELGRASGGPVVVAREMQPDADRRERRRVPGEQQREGETEADAATHRARSLPSRMRFVKASRAFDAEIDRLVYELYELTPEEITVVEKGEKS
jgi:hypothetical protein